MQSFLDEYVTAVGPLLVVVLFAVALRSQSPWLAASNVALGCYLLAQHPVLRESERASFDRDKQKMIGDRPTKPQQIAFSAHLMLASRYRHTAYVKVMGIAAIVSGVVQVFEYA